MNDDLEVPAFQTGTSFYTAGRSCEQGGSTSAQHGSTNSLEVTSMAVKKRAVTQEPLLSTVARKLGHAAGTITHMTHEFADNVSAMPETVAAKVRQAVKSGESKGRTRGRI